jgi:hypothetical protein
MILLHNIQQKKLISTLCSWLRCVSVTAYKTKFKVHVSYESTLLAKRHHICEYNIYINESIYICKMHINTHIDIFQISTSISFRCLCNSQLLGTREK